MTGGKILTDVKIGSVLSAYDSSFGINVEGKNAGQLENDQCQDKVFVKAVLSDMLSCFQQGIIHAKWRR